MSDDTQTSRGPQFHVLKHGQSIGPLTEDEVRVGLESGRFTMDDMVREEECRTWARLKTIVELPPSPAQPADTTLDWPALLRCAWSRFRADFAERPFKLGLIAVGVGFVMLTLTRWPSAFWLPWLGVAAVLGARLIIGGRHLRGALLLGVPVLITLFVMMRAGDHKPAASPEQEIAPVQLTEATATPTPIVGVMPSPAPVVEAAPEPPLVANVEEKPPQTPVPIAPAKDAAPVPSPALMVEASSEATPSPAVTPAPAAASVPTIPALSDAPVDPTPKPPGILTRFSNWLASVFNPPPPPPPPTPYPAPKRIAKVTPTPTPKAEFLNKHRNAFVIIKSNDRSGSGFVCRMGEATWVFTNAHVLAGAQNWNLHRLDGTFLTPGVSQSAGGATSSECPSEPNNQPRWKRSPISRRRLRLVTKSK